VSLQGGVLTPPQEGYGRRGGPGRYTRSRSRLSSFLCKERTKETPTKIELCSILEKRSLVLSFKKVQEKRPLPDGRGRFVMRLPHYGAKGSLGDVAVLQVPVAVGAVPGALQRGALQP